MYNYVIFGSDWDLYKISYNEVISMDNVRYISTPFENRSLLLKLLFRFHFSKKLNRLIQLPFKRIWNSGYYKFNFQNSNKIRFIFFSNWCQYEKEGFIKFLREKYPNSQIICFFQDLIELKREIDIYHLKNVFDLILSFDQIEASKYGLVYHQLVFSYYPIQISKLNTVYDVYFLGKDKNRLTEIIEIYIYLTSNNISCCFYLVDVDKDKQIYPSQIHYIKKMSYVENLKHVINSKCLLEVMQTGGNGYTQRMCEAIAYDKKILTNNFLVKNAPFYNECNISIFSKITEIDINFLRDSSSINYNFKDQLSPKNLLTFIEDNLNKK